jgi:hypothetical protein
MKTEIITVEAIREFVEKSAFLDELEQIQYYIINKQMKYQEAKSTNSLARYFINDL